MDDAEDGGSVSDMLGWFRTILNRLDSEYKCNMEIVRTHNAGLVLPVVVWLAEFMLLPTRMLSPSRVPLANCDDASRTAHFRKRAKIIDGILIFRLGVAIAALSFAPSLSIQNWVWELLTLLVTANVLAAVFHFGVLTGGNYQIGEANHTRAVLSIPRVIVLSLYNYIEVLIWFAALYAATGTFKDGKLDALSALYFSGVTALTIGYGDIVPIGATRMWVLAESLSGVLILVILLARMIGSAQQVGDYLRDSAADSKESGVPD